MLMELGPVSAVYSGGHLGSGVGDDRAEGWQQWGGPGGCARAVKSCSKNIHWPRSQQGLWLLRGQLCQVSLGRR